jgi:hypothetical protein
MVDASAARGRSKKLSFEQIDLEVWAVCRSSPTTRTSRFSMLRRWSATSRMNKNRMIDVSTNVSIIINLLASQ